jgi:hypothetical protein
MRFLMNSFGRDWVAILLRDLETPRLLNFDSLTPQRYVVPKAVIIISHRALVIFWEEISP